MGWLWQGITKRLQSVQNRLFRSATFESICAHCYQLITGLYIIPRHVRFIWLGSKLPDHYKTNVLTWLGKNPDYNFHLYIDSTTLPLESAKADVADMQTFCITNNIQFHDIGVLPKFAHLVQSPWYNDWVNGQHKIYAMAADYLRLAILSEGGIYSDIDTQCVKPIGTLLNKTGLFVWGSTKIFQQPMFADNCWIATKKNNPILQTCLRSMQQTYENLIFKGNLPEVIKIRISYTPLEHDPDVVYQTLRFPSGVNDADIGNTFSAGHILRILYENIQQQYGADGVRESIFELNEKVMHDAHRSWMSARKRAQRRGIILVDNVAVYQQQLSQQKLNPQLAALRG